MRALWPHLRAGLLLAHLVAITLMALPAPLGADRASSYEGPQAEEELARVASALRRVGLRVTPDQIAEASLRSARRILAVRRAALLPFEPYYALAGTTQGYRMFSGVALYSDRLWIEAQIDGGWRTLYLARDPEHDWHALALDHELPRSLLYRYPTRRYRKRWAAFAEVLADDVFAEVPKASRVRLSWLHSRVQTHAESREGTVPETRRRGTHRFAREP
jgi:hypothetical protein